MKSKNRKSNYIYFLSIIFIIKRKTKVKVAKKENKS